MPEDVDMRALRLISLFLLAACAGDINIDGADDTVPDDPTPDETDTNDTVDTVVVDTEVPVEDTEVVETEIPIDPRYDEARLVIDQPLPASIHLLDDGIPLKGRVVAKDGTVMPVDLTWVVGRQTIVGVDNVFRSVAGIYDVDVSVALPNGDRLSSRVGGVRLQSPYTGVWAGSVQLDGTTSYQGQQFQANCIGPFDFEVGMAGKVLEGSGGCMLSLIVIDPIDLTFDVTGELKGAYVGGRIGFNASFIQIPVGWEGNFTDASNMTGGFTANLFVAEIAATLEARKLSDYVMP